MLQSVYLCSNPTQNCALLVEPPLINSGFLWRPHRRGAGVPWAGGFAWWFVPGAGACQSVTYWWAPPFHPSGVQTPFHPALQRSAAKWQTASSPHPAEHAKGICPLLLLRSHCTVCACLFHLSRLPVRPSPSVWCLWGSGESRKSILCVFCSPFWHNDLAKLLSQNPIHVRRSSLSDVGGGFWQTLNPAFLCWVNLV